jgi:hypothetical protein
MDEEELEGELENKNINEVGDVLFRSWDSSLTKTKYVS